MHIKKKKLILKSPFPFPSKSSPNFHKTMSIIHESKSHVALLSSPGIGHIIPFLELAKRLTLHHNLQTTLFIVGSNSSPAEIDILQKASSINSLNIISLPPLTLLPSNLSLVDKIKAMMSNSLDDLRSAILSMNPRPVALIVDLFGTGALATAKELGMLRYVFMTTNAWLLALSRFFPIFDSQHIEDHASKNKPLKIPGSRPIRFEDTIEIFEINQEEVYDDFLHYSLEVGTADGILSNTWQDLEATTLKSLNEAKTLTLGKVNDVPVYPIGPLIRNPEPGLKSEILNWLDKQPKESVIYVSFGSGGTLSEAQITELAWGLELSQERFVWVIRPAMKNDDAAESYFTVGKTSSNPETETEKEYNLPEGFMKRTKERGLLVTMWAPQREILSHGSIGGFISHCGWNSTLESLMNGIPIIAWPLYAEQKMNATMLSEELRVGVRLKGIVVREEIEKMVRMIMDNDDEQGREIRDTVKEIKRSGEKAVGINGTSYDSLLQLARGWVKDLTG